MGTKKSGRKWRWPGNVDQKERYKLNVGEQRAGRGIEKTKELGGKKSFWVEVFWLKNRSDNLGLV